MSPRVLIADKLSPAAVDIFKARGVDADVITGLSKDELLKIIGDYDGLAVRSATKADKDVIAAAKNMKVIGRAGIGVDNVDIPVATSAGIVVMNTPFGNSITTAEHAIALMFALARQLPQADLSIYDPPFDGGLVWSMEFERGIPISRPGGKQTNGFAICLHEHAL